MFRAGLHAMAKRHMRRQYTAGPYTDRELTMWGIPGGIAGGLYGVVYDDQVIPDIGLGIFGGMLFRITWPFFLTIGPIVGGACWLKTKQSS